MQINSVGSISNTNFGLVFDPCMNKYLKETEDFLTEYRPEEVTKWNNKLEELKGMLPDDYNIYCSGGLHDNYIIVRSWKTNNGTEKSAEMVSRYSPEIYLRRTNSEFNNKGVSLGYTSDGLLVTSVLTDIIYRIRLQKHNNMLPK